MTKAQLIRQINFETQKLLNRIHKQSSHHFCTSTFRLFTPQKPRSEAKTVENDFRSLARKLDTIGLMPGNRGD